MLSTSVNCTSWIDARMVVVRSLTMVSCALAGMARRRRGNSARNALDCFDHVGAGLALHVDHDRGLTAVPGADFRILKSVDDVGDVADLDRRAVAERHHDVLVGIGGDDLVVGGDGVGLVRAVERAFWPGHIGTDNRRAQVVERDAVRGEP